MSKKSSNRRLIVEGNADSQFYSAILNGLGRSNIWIGPPTDFSSEGDGKGNAINAFSFCLDEMKDGQVTQLGLIIDADYKSIDGLGFNSTLEKLFSILRTHNYSVPDKPSAKPSGYYFSNSDGLPSVGIWIMPNCSDDGMLEDFIINAVADHEKPLLESACAMLTTLPVKKFGSHHKSKAEVFAWLAVQEIPGQNIASVIRKNLIDQSSGIFVAFSSWISKVFHDEQ